MAKCCLLLLQTLLKAFAGEKRSWWDRKVLPLNGRVRRTLCFLPLHPLESDPPYWGEICLW